MGGGVRAFQTHQNRGFAERNVYRIRLAKAKQLRQLAEMHSRRVAREQIHAAIDEPDRIPFNIPTGPCCNPETIEEFQQLLRVAIRARFLTTGEILEIILDQIIEAWGSKLHSKELGNVAEVRQPDDVCTRKLRHLTQARRSSVNMRTRLSNQLKALLKGYFPQALELCGDDLTTPMACALFAKWPSLQQLKKARLETIRRFYYAQNARRGDVIEKRLALIAQAVPLTNDPALIESSIITVQALTLGLRAAHTVISRYDREIARTFAQHPDASLFAALPGSGPAYSARLLAAFGSRRELFPSAQAMLNFSGIAPVLKRSGQNTTIHRRFARPLFLHQSFIEYANESIRHSLWARAFYQMHKSAQKSHWVIIRALAYKWIRILFRCWQEHTPYDELRYLKSLQKSRSPLLPYLAQPTTQPA